MKAVVAAFNQEKAIVGAFSVIVKTDCETDGALHSTIDYSGDPGQAAGLGADHPPRQRGGADGSVRAPAPVRGWEGQLSVLPDWKI